MVVVFWLCKQSSFYRWVNEAGSMYELWGQEATYFHSLCWQWHRSCYIALAQARPNSLHYLDCWFEGAFWVLQLGTPVSSIKSWTTYVRMSNYRPVVSGLLAILWCTAAVVVDCSVSNHQCLCLVALCLQLSRCLQSARLSAMDSLQFVYVGYQLLSFTA